MFSDNVSIKEDLDDIFANEDFIKPKSKLNSNKILSQNKNFNLKSIYDDIIKNTKTVLEYDEKELKFLGFNKRELIENYQLAVYHILKSQKYERLT